MKLFARYNRLNIIATIVIFLIGSCTFYFVLRYILIDQLDKVLLNEKQEIVEYVKAHRSLPEIQPTKDQTTVYTPGTGGKPDLFGNIYALHDGSRVGMRQISFSIAAGNNDYRIMVSKPLEETEDLLQVIIVVTTAMIALILLAGYLINRRVLGRLWQPFYHTIAAVGNYKISDQRAPELGETNVDEFALLNQSITGMTGRIQTEFQSLKNFTGQAAHEMQTPLAVIRTRLNTLVQNEDMLRLHGSQVQDMEQAVTKLSRLYQSLLLLTKVENAQFLLNEHVAIDEIVKRKVELFAEIILAKQIVMQLDVQPVSVRFHHHLAEILVNNLLTNALKYTGEKGCITISLQSCTLAISNTSPFPALGIDQVFKRFYRHGDTKDEGNGLGLSIVKQICELGGFTCNYIYEGDRHVFIVKF